MQLLTAVETTPVGADHAAGPGVDADGFVGGTPVWGAEGTATLACRAIHDITPDVKTFLFEPGEPAVFDYEAGQFVTLSLEIDGATVNRCYTISTPPTRPHLLGITVKRQPGGLVSNWLHDNLRPGVQITADGPFGTFTAGPPSSRYLFLSGGSGATPLMSMTRAAFDRATDDDILYVHSARTPDDILFRRELDLMANLSPNIAVRHVCEQDAPGERWNGLRGFLGLDLMRVLAPDLHTRSVYCCGPPPYMAAVRRLLRELSFDMSRYREETFTFDEVPAAEFVPPTPTFVPAPVSPWVPAAVPTAEVGAVAPAPTARTPPEVIGLGGGELGGDVATFTVECSRSGRSFPCRSGETLLDAAQNAGLTPPSSCGQGMCGTCKVSMASGTVDMTHQGGIRPREIAANKVLVCCSRPTSDVVIDL